MNSLKKKYIDQFGSNNITFIDTPIRDNLFLAIINLQKRTPIKLLITCGLSEYKQPIPENFNGNQHIELYFCLPSYWDLNEIENPSMNWVWTWIKKIAIHLIDKKTWYGIGHTIPCAKPNESLSPTMKQRYFFLTNPDFVKTELEPMIIEKNEKVHFLAIMPIFEDEFDFKMGKGTLILQKKFKDRTITELLDDYRMTSLKTKWRII